MNNLSIRKFCVAPMMGYTTPHARKFYRILSKKTFLFSEMIPSKTMLHCKTKDSIIENDKENPIALQVGGSDYQDLIKCSKIAKKYNYDEINLNVGCPSKAVQKGSFGACLMKDKILVRNCLKAMLDSTDIDVSIKCRIGVGKKSNYNFFSEFIEEIIKSGIKIIYVHARNAILNGLSPKANRTIPLLNYNFVTNIKKDFPQIQFILNGGIETIEQAYNLSKIHDGVMLGRLIQSNPFCLSKVDQMFFDKKTDKVYSQKIILEYFEYIKSKLGDESIYRLLSPLLNIFFGIPNNKKIKIEIQKKIENHQVDKLESLFLQFVDDQNLNNFQNQYAN